MGKRERKLTSNKRPRGISPIHVGMAVAVVAVVAVAVGSLAATRHTTEPSGATFEVPESVTRLLAFARDEKKLAKIAHAVQSGNLVHIRDALDPSFAERLQKQVQAMEQPQFAHHKMVAENFKEHEYSKFLDEHMSTDPDPSTCTKLGSGLTGGNFGFSHYNQPPGKVTGAILELNKLLQGKDGTDFFEKLSGATGLIPEHFMPSW